MSNADHTEGVVDVEKRNKQEAEMGVQEKHLDSDASSLVSQIPERKLSWVEATLLLLTEYVVL